MAYVDLTNAYTGRSQFDFEANRALRDKRIETEKLLRIRKEEELKRQKEQQFPTQKPDVVKESLQEKILKFTGGDVLARGLGVSLNQWAAKDTTDQIEIGMAEQQQKLIQAIRKNKEIGKDTSRLEAQLKAIGGEVTDYNDLYTEGITSKQVVGDALQLATTAATAYKAPSVLKGVVAKPGIVSGAIQGAKAGAKSGAVFGGASGFSQGLKQDKTVGDSLKQAAGGAVGGAVTGGVVGGVVGGISGGIQAHKAKLAEKHIDAITPTTKDMTPTEYQEYLNRGKISPKTAKHPAQYIMSERELKAANKYKDILQSKDPVKNAQAVIDKIGKRDKQVGNFLKDNNGIFNKSQLKTYLHNYLDKIDDVTVSTDRLDKAKSQLINNFVDGLPKKDMHTLWVGRKEFDQQIQKAFSGSPTMQNEVKKALRNGVQDFISTKTPNTTYADYMADMTDLFNMRDILTTKAAKERTLSAIAKLVKEKPYLKEILKYGLPTAVGGYLGSKYLED